jgi:soluble lytic murein transglycosylase
MILILLLLAVGLSVYWWWQGWLERSQDVPIRAAARRYGLMQLREAAAQEWADAEQLAGFAHEHCFDPATNTLAGTWYLRKLLQRYALTDGPVPYALADYNAGRANVLKWYIGAAATNSAVFTRQIGFPSTRDYVRSVMRRYARYRPVFPPDNS